ncbi:3-oxoacid CoA-transferase subunit A [Streptomyces griseoruber]|uniref:3-oxoacid CoA-transferase subunit A n=1 Tax=Streptomyces griseoruber TaxID=1943 RepID=UPI00379344E6
MTSKVCPSAAEAVAGIEDGATMIGGFGRAGQPVGLIDALLERGARELVVINNNAGNGNTGLAALLAAGRVRKIICSFPRQSDSDVFDRLYRAGKIELELAPQGTLAERNFGPIMAAAARSTVVQVDRVVESGVIDPETVVTPGIFVARVVGVGERTWLREGVFVGAADAEGNPNPSTVESRDENR